MPETVAPQQAAMAVPPAGLLPGADDATTKLEQAAAAAATAALADGLASARARGLRPPPRLSLSEWANAHGYLSPENSAEPGRFTSMRFQDGIMDAITDAAVERVTVMKSARVGYTTVLNMAMGYYVAQDPSPCMIVQPTVEDAEEYSKDSIAPMIRDTPVLAVLGSEPGSKDGKNNIRRKLFRGGASIRMVGANSPRGFRRVTVRVVGFDEVDGYPVQGAGAEGDQIKLGVKRTETFWNRKIIIGSTPTIKGVSRVASEYEKGDGRQYWVPCPHCEEKQVLKWANLKWPDGQPAAAAFWCVHCGAEIPELHKAWMIENGEWRGQRPFTGHASFHIWAAYSLFPNAAWGQLAAEFLEVHKKPSEFKVFVNTVLGETWEETGERVDESALMARRENYTAAPRQVLAVTFGADVQADRIELEFVGWGLDDESWGLGKYVLHGDPTGPDIWAALDTVIKGGVLREDGSTMRPMAGAIDANYLTQKVATFCRARWGQRVWAVRGIAGPKKPVWPARAGKLRTEKVSFFNVGVDNGKDVVYANLRVDVPGPGYCHYNMTYDANHFAQLTAEEAKVKFTKGMPQRVWELKPGKLRNEALDMRVYAYAALEGLKMMGLSLRKLARKQGISTAAVAVQRPAARAQVPAPQAAPVADQTPQAALGEAARKIDAGAAADAVAAGGARLAAALAALQAGAAAARAPAVTVQAPHQQATGAPAVAPAKPKAKRRRTVQRLVFAR